MGHAYRSGYEQIVGTRIASLQRARELIGPHLPLLWSIRSARIARIAGGVVGILGALSMVVLASLDDKRGTTHALLGGAVAAITTWLLTRVVLAVTDRSRRPLSVEQPKLTGDLAADLATIDASDPMRLVEKRLVGLEVWSAALPLVALSLLMPLTLHYVVSPLFDSSRDSVRSFAGWIQVSLLIVGHAHLALAWLSISFARKLRRMSHGELATMAIHRAWAKAWAITVGVSAVPGILLLLVPPVLTAITGLLFIPFMFIQMRRRVLMERTTMATAENATTRIRIGDEAPPPPATLGELLGARETELGARDDVDRESSPRRQARSA